MKVVILTGRRDALGDFALGLGPDVEWAENAADVLNRARTGNWNLVVVDAMTPGVGYKKFLTDLLYANAMLNTVVVTDMDDDAFHEDSEGLGVLCPVPAEPGRADGERAAERCRRIAGMS